MGQGEQANHDGCCSDGSDTDGLIRKRIVCLIRQQEVVSGALVLLEDTNCSGVWWKGKTTGHRQSRKVQGCIDDNFVTHMIEELMRGDTLLDLLLIHKEGLVRGLKEVKQKWQEAFMDEQESPGKTRTQKGVLPQVEVVSGVEWGLIFPEANGDYQSPINLNSREARYDPALLEVRLAPNYVVCRDCEVINDGHAIQILLKSKSVLIGGPLPRGHEFELHDVRFHWGRENQRGSEHTVNFKAFPMESYS
ncbi:PREDICTED: carbonic anhydrase-related protein-like [Tinamus guttatus]|uniref:carbonic anhydrase-related protein-like n=1 Tax=Tinamus guttatus TaxID=94827 RepID=UPI00052E7A56|nr:PREDICTED: carbonic anhydrase-related protein-like [Tinamus guttatus]